MTVNHQLFASLTQEKCALTQNGILNRRSQQANNEAITLVTGMSTASLQAS